MPRSLVLQMLHYLSRPHVGPRTTPLLVPAAWRGSDLRERDDWCDRLTPSEVDELERAVLAARATGKPTQALTARDLPLPTLATKIARWREEVARGRGFLVIRGVPVDRFSSEDAERFFWGLGLHLGAPGAQNQEGHLLGHVRDHGVDFESGARGYRTRMRIAYHCDAADLVGLLCLQTAKEGGGSRIASSVTVYNEILRRRPDLALRLYRPFRLDTRSEGGLRHFPVYPCRYADGELRTFYHSDYFRSVSRHPDAPPLTAEDNELLDLYEEIASSPDVYFEMDFERGDIQLLSNHTQVHSRTAYVDDEDPEKKRHLLRLWVSLPFPRTVHYRALALRSFAELLATLARERWRQRGAQAP